MTNSAAFVQTYKPFRKKYTEQYQPTGELFSGPQWTTRNSYLTDQLIEQAISAQLTLGYLQGSITTVLGVDIDNHRGKPEAYQLTRYEQIREKLGDIPPSTLVRTPRGLHAYWYLSQPFPTELLCGLAKEKLGKIPEVEIKPDMRNALRIPQEGKFIDPETFRPLYGSAADIMGTAPRYQYVELFANSYEQSLAKRTMKHKRQTLISYRTAEKLQGREMEIAPGNSHGRGCAREENK